MDLDKIIQAARPDTPRGWAAGPAGQRVLAQVLTTEATTLRPKRRIVGRPLLAATLGVGVLAGAGAAAVALLAEEPPPDWSPPSGSVGCADSLSPEANLAVMRIKDGQGAIGTCRSYWATEAPAETPAEPLVACVYRFGNDGGGVIVASGKGFGSPREACGSIDMFVAPADVAN